MLGTGGLGCMGGGRRLGGVVFRLLLRYLSVQMLLW